VVARGWKTPLDRVFTVFDLKPRDVVEAAREIAAELGVGVGISRQHLARLRVGKSTASEEKMYLLVATIRDLTGFAVRASDLFAVEPPMPPGGTLLSPDILAYGRHGFVPVSCLDSTPAVRRVFVPEPTGDSGDAAFEALYVEYGSLLRAIATRRYGVPPADAEGLVHDSFIAYLQRHTQIRDVKLWLMGAVSNACKHYWRDRKREAPLPGDVEETADPAGAEALERWEWRLTVGAVVARLGEKCRETLHRYYWREETKETIAGQLSTSPGNVLQLLVTCRRRMRELLRGLGKWHS